MSMMDRVRFRLLGARAQIAKEDRLRRRIDRMHRAGIGLSPMAACLDWLCAQDLLGEHVHALEPFGMCGLRKTLDYVDRCESLEFYEINGDFAEAARRRLARYPVRVIRGDSILALRDGLLLRDKYDLVLIDNPGGCFGPHCEHFDLFPYIWRVMAPSGTIILNAQLDRWMEAVPAEHSQRREAFYGDAARSTATLLEHYSRLAEHAGHRVRNAGIVAHPGSMLFVVLTLSAS